MEHSGTNQSMKPTAPIAIQLQCVCHDTLPWLISFSLDHMNQFRSMLPRLAHLYDRFVTCSVDNFFHGFPNRLRSHDSVTFKFYSGVESWLSFMPAVEWDYYAQKVGQTVLLCDRPRKRFWEQLHDVLNEALGVKVLRSE